MIPNAADVIRVRWVGAVVLRLIGIVALLIGLAAWASWFAEGVRDGDLLDVHYYFRRISGGFLLLITGVVLVVVPARLMRWIAPVPRQIRCPKCGHDVTRPVEAQCPECGLGLTPEFAGAGVAKAEGGSGVLVARAVVRIAGLAFLILGFDLLLDWVYSNLYFYNMTDFLEPFALLCMIAGSGLWAIGLMLIVIGPWRIAATVLTATGVFVVVQLGVFPGLPEVGHILVPLVMMMVCATAAALCGFRPEWIIGNADRVARRVVMSPPPDEQADG